MTRLSRRAFVKNAAVSAAGAALSVRSWAAVPGANSDIRVGMVGLGSRSKQHLEAYDALSGVRIVALCDPDRDRLEAAARARRARGQEVRTFADVRDLLARPDIDAVSIATPNHWHALIAVWACQAGKDVYVEKPVSHEIWEGRQEVAAAAKYGRIVQSGTQSRSRPDVAAAIAWLKEGHLGRVLRVRGLCYKRRPSIGLTYGPQPIPPSVDYNLWTGPAPMEPLRRKHLHYDWHWVWPTGNGDLGNQGVHQMDVARWFLGDPGLPPHTLALGGRLGYVDDGRTPNTLVLVHDYPGAPLIFEVRGLSAHPGTEEMDRYPDGRIGADIGVVVDCEGGTVVASNGGRYRLGAAVIGDDFGSVEAFDHGERLIRNFTGPSVRHFERDHFGNFLEAVRRRDRRLLRAPIECGHLSSSLCHLGNISYRLGHGTAPAEIRERIQGDAPLAEAYGRMIEHLSVHGIDTAKTEVALGVPISIDPDGRRFAANAAANALLRRSYRDPFVLPELA